LLARNPHVIILLLQNFACSAVVLYAVDQHRILFYKKLKHHNSILTGVIAKLCQCNTLQIAANYDIKCLDVSIKRSVSETFVVTIGRLLLSFSAF